MHCLPRKRAKVSLNQPTFARRATLTQPLHFCGRCLRDEKRELLDK